MTLRIEKKSDPQVTTIRLIGHVEGCHLEELKSQIGGDGPNVVLDLEEVTLVDVDVVRFLEQCETAGVQFCHPSSYILEWIQRERDTRGKA